MTVWCPVMFRGELPMLECRLNELDGFDVQHVVVEAPMTHRGVTKPLVYGLTRSLFRRWSDRFHYVIDNDLRAGADPWVNEHHQRNSAWRVIDELGADGDLVIIGDLDELPSAELLAWEGPWITAVRMRTCVFAVDWEVAAPLPPTCVAARLGFLRSRITGATGLAELRDSRGVYPQFARGGWHLSWLGGPEAQKQKLDTATCHTELLNSPEGKLIADGTRYRTGENGGGLAVKPVDVDESWPRWVFERRCPATWFRPREPVPA